MKLCVLGKLKFRDIFVDRAQAFRRVSFGGPEIRDGVCILDEEEEKAPSELHFEGEDAVDGGFDGGLDGSHDDYLVDPRNGVLSMAHRGLVAGPPHQVVDRNWHWVTALDLSHNRIKYLSDFPKKIKNYKNFFNKGTTCTLLSCSSA